MLLDDILASIARLPSSKRSLRTYRLNSEEHIQMLTALVLQLIQCVVILPENLKNKNFPVPSRRVLYAEIANTIIIIIIIRLILRANNTF